MFTAGSQACCLGAPFSPACIGRSAWKKRWRSFAGRYADHPLFRRLSSASTSAAARGRDAAEDLRERWETSDSPFVHRIQVGALDSRRS